MTNGNLKMRVLTKRCVRCGCAVPFRVWRGFKPIAHLLVGRCEGCHSVYTLKEERIR